MLAKFKNNGVDKDRLKSIYTSTVRSVLEYTSNTYHSQLNRGQNNLLVRVQKKCLKIIYGYQNTYEDLLKHSSLSTLEARRGNLFEKFTAKTHENLKYNHWFPLKVNPRNTRTIRPYLEERANTDRLYRSPVYAMRRLLNNQKPIEYDPLDMSGILNKP